MSQQAASRRPHAAPVEAENLRRAQTTLNRCNSHLFVGFEKRCELRLKRPQFAL